jgi:hypothetical protein
MTHRIERQSSPPPLPSSGVSDSRDGIKSGAESNRAKHGISNYYLAHTRAPLSIPIIHPFASTLPLLLSLKHAPSE